MKIRIAFTIPNFDTAGSGKALLNLALGLDKEKFEAHIVCASDKGAFFQTVKDSGIPVHVFNYLPSRKPLSRFWKELRNARSVWRKIKPDIIHSFHYSDNYTEGLAARLARAKWVFTKKNMSWGGSGNGWKFRSALAIAIVVQNTDMITQFYPDSKKVTLIPRGVNTMQFEAQKPKPEIRTLMQSEPQKRIIICVANMVPVKGVELLIKAFGHLATKNQDWDVWLVGDINNDYGKQLINQVENENLQDRIHFSGKQSNVREYLDHAEIFVLPTKDKGEGSPVAMLEAMANGKVVIGSAVPGVKDQLQEFSNNQFEPNKWQDLSDKLNNFMNSTPQQNSELGAAFRNWVLKNYTIEQEVARHEAFYLEIANV